MGKIDKLCKFVINGEKTEDYNACLLTLRTWQQWLSKMMYLFLFIKLFLVKVMSLKTSKITRRNLFNHQLNQVLSF